MMEERSPQVIFLPDWRGANPYLALLEDALGSHGISVTFGQYPRGHLKLTRVLRQKGRHQCVHIHWTVGLFSEIFWSKNSIKTFAKAFLFALDLLIVRTCGAKIVWTVHNLYEHDTKNSRTEQLCRKILGLLSHSIIAHSNGAKNAINQEYGVLNSNKIRVIPHGNYLDTVETKSPVKFNRESLGLAPDSTVVLFFGAIRPYKGLETLIDAFSRVTRQDLALVIAGWPFDTNLTAWIRNVSENDIRIKLHDYFIPSDDVHSFFASSDYVILPFRKTLTSGSVILAMGFGKPLILPDHAKILGLPPHSGALYFEDELTLASIFQTLSQNNATRMGKLNYDHAKGLDWNVIAGETAKLY